MRKKSVFTVTRRRFMALTTAVATTALLERELCGEGTAALEPKLASDPMRPQFHLLPAKNWMNDPNGPIYFGGKYHMFFQYNPQAAVWGNMSWYHSVSPDMIHWRSLPVAMTPTPGSVDSFGCFSGSALQVGKRVYQVYTGTRKSSSDKATIRDGQNDVQESQCLAYSDDPALVNWTKVSEPVIPAPPPGMSITGFRDPSAWRQGDWYYMTVGAGEANVGGCVLLYRSKVSGDLKTWEYRHKLTGGVWNGTKTANPCDDGEMWECPDFFALDNGHVLIYSTLGKVFWQSGDLDAATMKFSAKRTGELDLGAFYAPKTQLDGKGRRILWGWVPEKRSEDAMREAGWSGMMALPRVLNLEKDGRLRMTVLPELQTLRAGKIPSETKGVKTWLRVEKACGEVLCTANDAGFDFDMVMTVEGSHTELLRIAYTAANRRWMVDGHEIAAPANTLPHLHAYLDGSVMELLIDQSNALTKRFYYSSGVAPAISIQVRHAKAGAVTLQGWSVAPISNDRLSTPAPTA